MTSTSFISGTGLKKCSPAKRSGRFVLAASSVMQSDEVFDRKIVWGGRALSSARRSPASTSMFSVIASMIRSALCKPSNVVVPVRFASVAPRDLLRPSLV